jgi:hypothetical protein
MMMMMMIIIHLQFLVSEGKYKDKVVPVLFLTEHPAMKTY